MTTMTLAVPNELKRKMEQFKEINWSEVARQSFSKKLTDLEMLEKMKKKSNLTHEDSLRFGKQINAALTKKWN